MWACCAGKASCRGGRAPRVEARTVRLVADRRVGDRGIVNRKTSQIMPSLTYRLFRDAIIGRKQVTCYYQGLDREICPHVLGHKHGKEAALTYQFAGQSASGLPAGGEWRCLFLAEVKNARLRDGPWHSRPYTQPQTCVDIIDVEVAP
jgi:hypothetical protein